MKILRHPDEWARGAIGLPNTDLDKGLLFDLPKAAPWPVSMDGVDFALDVYWLNEGGMVLDHAELFPGMPTFWPDCSARYVLELLMADTPMYKIGDFVELP
jgi:uncharacterized membrane protein (UPF0127 family)